MATTQTNSASAMLGCWRLDEIQIPSRGAPNIEHALVNLPPSHWGETLTASLSLHRRTYVERYVLDLIRGAREPSPTKGLPTSVSRERRSLPQLTLDQLASFDKLRSTAIHAGLAIQPRSTSHMSFDELQLLHWLAWCQRVDSTEHFVHSDPALVEAVERCAAVLSAIGVRLPALSLLGGQMR